MLLFIINRCLYVTKLNPLDLNELITSFLNLMMNAIEKYFAMNHISDFMQKSAPCEYITTVQVTSRYIGEC